MFRIQNNDNGAYIAYFDSGTQLGFTYDAKTNKISISKGGMGEPNIYEVPIPFAEYDTITEFLSNFETACRAYVIYRELRA